METNQNDRFYEISMDNLDFVAFSGEMVDNLGLEEDFVDVTWDRVLDLVTESERDLGRGNVGILAQVTWTKNEDGNPSVFLSTYPTD